MNGTVRPVMLLMSLLHETFRLNVSDRLDIGTMAVFRLALAFIIIIIEALTFFFGSVWECFCSFECFLIFFNPSVAARIIFLDCV